MERRYLDSLRKSLIFRNMTDDDILSLIRSVDSNLKSFSKNAKVGDYIIAAENIRLIVTVDFVVYKGLKLVVYRMLTIPSTVRVEKRTRRIVTRLCQGSYL